MHRYDGANFNPPAPVYTIKITSPPDPPLGINEVTIEVLMLLDTGADGCCLPRSVIAEFEKKRGFMMPYTSGVFVGFDGQKRVYKVYDLIVESSDIGGRSQIEFAETPDGEGIIGRDVLNEVAILYDGPNLGWEIK
jgi:hypothetical protein